MQAYDNPAFVEDIVRDVVVALRDDVRVARARVRRLNQESIHDHSAVAEVRWEPRQWLTTGSSSITSCTSLKASARPDPARSPPRSSTPASSTGA